MLNKSLGQQQNYYLIILNMFLQNKSYCLLWQLLPPTPHNTTEQCQKVLHLPLVCLVFSKCGGLKCIFQYRWHASEVPVLSVIRIFAANKDIMEAIPNQKPTAIKTESARRWSNKWTKILYQEYLHCIANFCKALLIIFSKQVISSNTKRRKWMLNFVWNA